LARLEPGPRRDALREEVIRAWLPVSRRLALHYRDRGESTDDLCQVAALGLVKAVNRYDPERGPFVNYALPVIRGEIKRHFRDHLWDVHVPRRVQELRRKVRIAYQELQAEGHEEPPLADLAARTGLEPGEVSEGLEALRSFKALSLEAAFQGLEGDTQGCLGETLAGADGGFDLVVDREAVRPGLKKLAPRESRILYLRFFGDMTQSRIADDLGISQMHVCRLLAQTCTELREQALNETAAT
jgi:RNA polymerase sigma-B factor